MITYLHYNDLKHIVYVRAIEKNVFNMVLYFILPEIIW